LQLKTGEHFKFATTVDSLLAAAIAQEEAAAQNQIRANAKYLKEMRCKHRKPEEGRTRKGGCWADGEGGKGVTRRRRQR